MKYPVNTRLIRPCCIIMQLGRNSLGQIMKPTFTLDIKSIPCSWGLSFLYFLFIYIIFLLKLPAHTIIRRATTPPTGSLTLLTAYGRLTFKQHLLMTCACWDIKSDENINIHLYAAKEIIGRSEVLFSNWRPLWRCIGHGIFKRFSLGLHKQNTLLTLWPPKLFNLNFHPIRWLINPLTAKLFNLNFHPLEVVSRWRDPQLQASENYSHLTKWRSTVFKYCWLMSHFIFNMF